MFTTSILVPIAVALLTALSAAPAAARPPVPDDDRTCPQPAAIAAIGFASPAGVYGIGDEIVVTVAFDRPVTVAPGAAPVLVLDIGGAARPARYAGGGGTAALAFAYAVAEGDADADGIAVAADRLSAPVGGIAGPAGAAASLTHRALGPDPTRRVDGVRPGALFATVDRDRLAVTWDEPLMSEDGLASPGGFALFVGGAPRRFDAARVDRRRVLLALDGTVADGAWVTLSYAPPESRPVRDLAGNAAAGFSLTVTARDRATCALARAPGAYPG